MKLRLILLVLICLCVSLSFSAQWSFSTTLNDGKIFYAEISTGSIEISDQDQCKCDYSINWILADSTTVSINSINKTGFSLQQDCVIFTSHPSEYASYAEWMKAVKSMMKDKIKQSIIGFMVENINKQSKISGTSNNSKMTFPIDE